MTGQDLVGCRVASTFSEDVKPFGSQGPRKGTSVRYDVRCVGFTVFHEFRQRHDLPCNVVQVVGGTNAREHGVVEPSVKGFILGGRQQKSTLRSGEGFVAGTCHQICAFTQRVLELTSSDQSEHVSSVVHHRSAHFLGGVGHLLKGCRKQKNRLTKQGNRWLNLANRLAGRVNVGFHPLLVPRVRGQVQVPQPNSAHPCVRNVPSISG